MEKQSGREDGLREVVDLAVFFDVDRCMYDTEKGFSLLADVVGKVTQYKADDLLASYAQAKRRGESFNYVSDINKRLGDKAYQLTVQESFIEAGRRAGLRMKGATGLLHYTLEQRLPMGFVTFGDSSGNEQSWIDAQAGQIGKIRAANFDEYPHFVCSDVRKGDLFSSWVDFGDLVIPGKLSQWGQPYVAKQAVLIDDKIESFANMPPQVIGIHAVPTDKRNSIRAQAGYVPGEVVSVVGLTEALGALKHVVSANQRRR